MAMAASSPPVTTTMRAVQYDGYGGGADGLKHVEVPIPTPKNGEVLIKMEAASANPIDWKIQSGMVRPFLPRKFPTIPGDGAACDLAGEVAAVGGGVSGFEIGDKVIAINFPSGGGRRRHRAPGAARRRRRHERAAQEERPRHRGVGHFAVQLAALAGHRVTATCGARNLSLAADEALDYASPDGAALRSPSGRLYDAVVHCAPPLPWKVFDRVLATGGGVVVDITPSAAAFATAARQRVTFARKRLTPLLFSPSKEDMQMLVGMAREGKLKAVIDSSYSLSDAPAAWAKSMGGHATGKVIVKFGEER